MKLPSILEKHRSAVEEMLKDIVPGPSGRQGTTSGQLSEPGGDMESALSALCQPLYDMMRYHLGWLDEKGNPARSDAGKALRPALCLFSCEAAGGDYKKALPAAAALELVHNFSLIHDDIQDDDRERRHRPTVWTIWGKPQAINAGTAMRLLANAALVRLQEGGISLQGQWHISRRLDEISLRLLEGQYLDISYESRFDIGVNDYLVMVSGKTAALISGSMEIGAYLGTEDPACIAGFRETGRNLGLAFQIRDDILGIWGDRSETGKPAGNDIRRRKKSFPVAFALENTPEKVREELTSLYQNSRMDDRDVERVLEIFASVDTQANAQKMVEKYSLAAGAAFNSLDLPAPAKADMEELVQFLTGRTY